MITITKLNGKEVILNSDLIEFIEANPDTTITMTTGRKVLAKESVEYIVHEIIEYRRRIHIL